MYSAITAAQHLTREALKMVAEEAEKPKAKRAKGAR
jgi:hypothetical protein